ncbi:glycosyltransferase family 4 protein [Vineibacter terrae]|uniref:Glycosyltransferase family 4 protein n=1 Tax=Vineibacter terrae TaxID=2586908 RepID=A0A5C8PBY8_9HYPH|nr:glycosyltransferase family 4 protein [Vineibacter terrae]TXL70970.1 glycosyltransferase family 4 protein [Vineibacter terrae]
MPPAPNSVLLLTLPPILGGVTSQGRLVADLLQREGHDVTIAWRAYYQDQPELSAPSWTVPVGRRPAARDVSGWPWRRVAVGTWLPELEWAHHQPWAPWRVLLESHARHVVVSGNNLAGWGPTSLGLPSLQWIATPYMADRIDRTRKWPAWRRTYDSVLNAWMGRAHERRSLEQADTVAISRYTLDGLAALTPKARLFGVVPIPVDTGRFTPDGRERGPKRTLRIGFNGRIDDPRKNMELLVQAVALAANVCPDIELHVRGPLGREDFITRYGAAGIAERLVVGPPVKHDEFPDWYRSLDIFAIPSHQEGLSIVGTEAMASGCAVLSTRCGGPQDFVLDGETGLLSGFAPREFADRLIALLSDAALRRRLADSGVALIRERYAQATFEQRYMEAFTRTFGG